MTSNRPWKNRAPHTVSLLSVVGVLLTTAGSARANEVRTTITLRTADENLPRYACILAARPESGASMTLRRGWAEQLDAYAACLNQRGLDPTSPPCTWQSPLVVPSSLLGPPVQPSVANMQRAFDALQGVAPVRIEMARFLTATARVLDLTSEGSPPLVPICSAPNPHIPGAAFDRVLLLHADIPHGAFGSDRLTLDGATLTIVAATSDAADPRLTVIGGHYHTTTPVALRGGDVALDIVPRSVVRALNIPEAWTPVAPRPPRVSAWIAGPLDDAVRPAEHPRTPLAVGQLVALPVPTPTGSDVGTLEVELLAPDGSLAATLRAHWRAANSRAELSWRLLRTTFSWQSDEFPAAVACPSVTLTAFPSTCEVEESATSDSGATARICRYTCQMTSPQQTPELGSPLQVNFFSEPLADRWNDVVGRVGQRLLAGPDAQTRHLWVDSSAWPQEFTRSDEIDEVNIISELDQVYHLYLRERVSKGWLVTVPGARAGTPLRILPIGYHTFSRAPPVLVDHGTIVLPPLEPHLTWGRFGLRIGTEIMGGEPSVPWAIGLHAQLSVRWVIPGFRYRWRYFPIETSIHYMAGELPYSRVRSLENRGVAVFEREWFSRLGFTVAILAPVVARRFYVGVTGTWMFGWPFREQNHVVGWLWNFWSVGGAMRFNVSSHWSFELDVSLQTIPSPRYTSPDLLGQPRLEVNWGLGADFRLALRYWF